MIIKSIELTNIRSYTNTTIGFEKGVNFLSGDIGSGKSSILLAVEFALFGFKRGDLEGYHILRKGELEGNVKLILENPKNNEEIEIFRKIKRSKTNDTISQENGYIKIQNSIEDLAPSELNAFIFDYLNFPKEFLTKDKNLVYRFTIYTPQEQLKEVLFSSSEKRLEVIRKIFGIDKYKQLIDASAVYLSDLKSEKKVFDAKLEDDSKEKSDLMEVEKQRTEFISKIDQLTKKLDPAKEKISKIREAIEKRDIILEKLNTNRTNIEKKLSIIERIKTEIKTLEEGIELQATKLQKLKETDFKKLKTEIQEKIKTKENTLKDLIKEKTKFQDIEKQFETIQKEKDEIVKKINEQVSLEKLYFASKQNVDYILTKCQLSDLENEVTKLNTSMKKSNKLKEESEKLNESIITSKTKSESLKNQIDEKEKFLVEFDKLDNCPTCKQEVDCNHKEKISKDFSDELEKLKKEKSDIRIEVNSLNDKILINNKKLENLITFEKQLIELNEKRKLLSEKSQKEKLEYEKQQEFKKQINNLKKQNNEIKLEEINKKIEKFTEWKVKIERINENEKEILEIISKLKIEMMELDHKFSEIESIEKLVKEKQNQSNELKNKLKTEDTLKEKLDETNKKEIEIKNRKTELLDMQEKLFNNEKIITSKISEYKTSKDNYDSQIKKLKEKSEKNKKLKQELKHILNTEDFVSKQVVNVSQTIEKAVFTKYYAEFNEEFEKLFKELIEDNDIDVRLDEIFSIIIEQNGYDIDIKNLSGGEKSSLAIAYRLGLKKIIEDNLVNSQKLDLLILDEPTDGFSREQISRLGYVLKDSGLKQILLVSHDESIESISDNTIHIEKINHISHVE